VPSYFRDPEAPEPNVPRRIGVIGLIERGDSCRVLSIVFRVVPEPGVEPVRSSESLELRYVARDELAQLDFWASTRPIRDAFLADPNEIVVE
jgi:hypothetical protein